MKKIEKDKSTEIQRYRREIEKLRADYRFQKNKDQ